MSLKKINGKVNRMKKEGKLPSVESLGYEVINTPFGVLHLKKWKINEAPKSYNDKKIFQILTNKQ